MLLYQEGLNNVQEQYDNPTADSLVEQVSEQVSTDKILDLKNGIYNLFVSLFNDYTIDFGPIKAVELSTQFLDEISENFKQILNQNTESKEKP
jgi:hypothetical protein